MTTEPDRQGGDGLALAAAIKRYPDPLDRFPEAISRRRQDFIAGYDAALSTTPQPTRDAAEGAVPERETWWLAERIGQNQYAAEHGELPSLTPDPWRAARFKTEKEAFDFILRLATLRDEMQQTEHIFINKPHREHRFSFPPRDASLAASATPQPAPDAMRPGETRQGVCTACGGHGVVRVPVVGGPFTNIAERESHDNEGEE